MSDAEANITMDGVTINPRSVRIADASYPVPHIQAVTVVEDRFEWAPLIPVGFGLFFIYGSTLKFGVGNRFAGYAYLALAILCILRGGYMASQTNELKKFTVELTVGGKNRIIATFQAPIKDPGEVSSNLARAEKLRTAIQEVL